MTPLAEGALLGTQHLAWLHEGWRCARTPPGACADPHALDAAPLEWHAATVPGTVASALHADLDLPGAYDADDWWYRVRFDAPRDPQRRYRLRFDGLATLADVWLNGTPILASRNMFVGQRVDVTAILEEHNELVIRFAALDAALAVKRPRPRWRTALVSHQNLRWFRTTLVGRIPGWTPAVTPVGPWGPVALEAVDRAELATLSLRTWADGTIGHVKLDAAIDVLDGHRIDAARLRLDDAQHALAVEARSGGVAITGELELPDVALWWPHTHGTPRLAACRLEVRLDGEWIAAHCGAVGFRALALDTTDGQVRFRINGVPVFCRGACWTPLDVRAIRASPEALRQALEMARDAGINMIRVGGTMAYESEAFYRLCDELGILVWQDFMFANMDYPVWDPAFRAEAEAEVRYQLARLHRHACIAAYCGGSEIAQQAAMLGLPADQWSNDFFAEALPRAIAQQHPGIPYFPSTPWGGALPFHVATGVSHYYGVGAYRRPLADVKGARVKFATECLAFANVPDPSTTALVVGTPTPPPHHPKWKAHTPRDTGAGWDFEDIRDHYLRALFRVDPVALRSQDLARYYALSRVASGEAMRRTFAEWRAPASECGGALVWFNRDFWPGAGWGIVDSTGRPKAAWWYLKRAWAPRSVHFTDEGLDGLAIHVVNESDAPWTVALELDLLRHGQRTSDGARREVRVPARGASSLSADALVGYFCDPTAAYRFGPAKHDVIAVRLRDPASGDVLAEDFHFPAGLDLPRQANVQLDARAAWLASGEVELRLRTDTFLQAVAIECEGFRPDDDYFHLAPGIDKRVRLVPLEGAPRRFRADLEALNLDRVVTVRAERGAEREAA